MVDKYLFEPNSPMRSEELYIGFLEAFIEGGERIPEDIRERASARLAEAMLNRPGSKAADFRIVTREGRIGSLREMLRQDTAIVMFYDPDCSQCKEFTRRLSCPGNSLPYRLIAVDVAGDSSLWDASKNGMPEEWTVAFATEDIEDKELYSFPALPSFYLLAPDGTVLLKDFPL